MNNKTTKNDSTIDMTQTMAQTEAMKKSGEEKAAAIRKAMELMNPKPSVSYKAFRSAYDTVILKNLLSESRALRAKAEREVLVTSQSSLLLAPTSGRLFNKKRKIAQDFMKLADAYGPKYHVLKTEFTLLFGTDGTVLFYPSSGYESQDAWERVKSASEKAFSEIADGLLDSITVRLDSIFALASLLGYELPEGHPMPFKA